MTSSTIEALRAQLQHWESKHHRPRSARRITTGCEALDRLLPQSGFLPGRLVEWLSDKPGSGAETLAWLVAMRAVGKQGTVVVVDRAGDFYPPAAMAWGLKPQQLMIVRTRNKADTMWSLDQTLRCSAVTVVWAALDKIAPSNFRRLQLAAEEGATLGLLLRPAAAHGQPSWSDLQLLVEPHVLVEPHGEASRDQSLTSGHHDRWSQQQPRANFPPKSAVPQSPQPAYRRAWTVSLLRCRGGTAGGSIRLQMEEQTGNLQAFEATTDSHETRALHLAAQLARPAARRRSARA